MAQHDYVIANDTAANVRSDLNDALSAIVSQNSGASAPSPTYANMLWYDTSNNILKMRSEADDAWIDLGTLNQSTNEFEVANLTELTQTQAEDDTDTTFGLVSGERLAEAVAANAGGGLTLLGTLTTTSGTAHTLSGLDLTSYKFLRIVFDDVQQNSGGNRKLVLNGDEITDNFGDLALAKGVTLLDFSTGLAVTISDDDFFFAAQTFIERLTVSSSDTSLSFTWTGSEAFTNGTIEIYGEA